MGGVLCGRQKCRLLHSLHDRRPGASRVNKNKIKNDMNAPSVGDRAHRGHHLKEEEE